MVGMLLLSRAIVLYPLQISRWHQKFNSASAGLNATASTGDVNNQSILRISLIKSHSWDEFFGQMPIMHARLTSKTLAHNAELSFPSNITRINGVSS